MRHNKHHASLGVTREHRKAMLSNMGASLIKHGRIETTLTKAKALRPFIEKVITKAKKASVATEKADAIHLRRMALKDIRDDTLVGMGFSTIISIAIVFATAATLHKSGITTINSAAEAAEALRPVAGSLASFLFAAGIIGTGLLAVPVLAGSAAYAATEMVGLAGSLDAKPWRARFFYGVIVVTTLVGALFQKLGFNPIQALYWTAVINGILAVPLMVLMMMIVRNPLAMGTLILPPRLAAIGWAATAVMAAATLLFFVSLF